MLRHHISIFLTVPWRKICSYENGFFTFHSWNWKKKKSLCFLGTAVLRDALTLKCVPSGCVPNGARRLAFLSWRARVWEAMPEQVGVACVQRLVKNAVRADCVEPYVPVGWDTMGCLEPLLHGSRAYACCTGFAKCWEDSTPVATQEQVPFPELCVNWRPS